MILINQIFHEPNETLRRIYLTSMKHREGIANDNLDEVERKFVHPNLVASLEGTDDIEVSDGIGS